jgi:hypothetical protein
MVDVEAYEENIPKKCNTKIFSDVDDVSNKSVCTGKPYCPHLKGACVSPATHPPIFIIHPLHIGLCGRRQ